jgi:hypothetical protein
VTEVLGGREEAHRLHVVLILPLALDLDPPAPRAADHDGRFGPVLVVGAAVVFHDGFWLERTTAKVCCLERRSVRSAVIYRYVLHLESAEGRRTVRWTFAHAVGETETIELPLFGSWYVVRAVTDDDPGAGVLYCRPAD